MRPSGDQAGAESNAGLLVRLVIDAPFAVIVKMSLLPARLLAKAIIVPPADQAGEESSKAAPSFVRLVLPVPPGLITQMSPPAT